MEQTKPNINIDAYMLVRVTHCDAMGALVFIYMIV